MDAQIAGFFGIRSEQSKYLGERGEMRGGQVRVAVLDQVEMLDQQVAPALAFAKQFLHLTECGGIYLPSLRVIRPAPPPRTWMNAAIVF